MLGRQSLFWPPAMMAPLRNRLLRPALPHTRPYPSMLPLRRSRGSALTTNASPGAGVLPGAPAVPGAGTAWKEKEAEKE